ncbi:iron only hydrogenase large subunit-like protein [Ruminiclostridium sufflavum DSM 19573]|uniref:Iron only hydrogenase large subunit-like protein n=1 Tax=Ruminiclostridium sufflavum DSM 19573 TaxID=1121337 RepID=A0A318XMG0_9FIRM|nr:[Fe-Fe] hydrogenase large subunit C-terminal domain-containing protein [Ruminiclostridium sufflavum]PYG87749.1 iron only hydrogenase large subunit-like protein [Ruminiclostridium sufflavum DSM 19573]
MQAFNELYKKLAKAAVENRTNEELKNIRRQGYDSHQLDCLLHPEKYASVWRIADCNCSDGETCSACTVRCLFDAIDKDEKGNTIINKDLCIGCSECIDSCKAQKLTASKDILPALAAVKSGKGPVYAMIAPAFISQFSKQVTPGKLRSAFKSIGFAGMVEVALFADILTLKEALEFDRTILSEKDYLLTSCCCPMWIAMLRKIYKQFMPHVPGSVSPMVACGRSIKILEPDSVTVFIGPCIAKKSEAKEPDIADAVDYVLTFQEIHDIFDFANINPAEMEEDSRDHSSKAGRIYARTGGVSEAVKNTLERLNPNREIVIRTQQANGIRECKEMLNELKEGRLNANFLEGMGCVGGCVGGPKAILNREEGRENVNQYGNQATYVTPVDNPYVMDLLHRLGFDTVEKLLEHSDIFTREFE